MMTGWLLLLLVVFSQSVDCQSATNDETYDDVELLSKHQKDAERMLDDEQELLQLLQQRESYLNVIGTSQFPTTCAQLTLQIPHLQSDVAVNRKPTCTQRENMFITYLLGRFTIFRT